MSALGFERSQTCLHLQPAQTRHVPFAFQVLQLGGVPCSQAPEPETNNNNNNNNNKIKREEENGS